MVQNYKKSVCCAFYFRNHISYGLHLWYTCMYKRIISPGFFLISSKFWFSGSLGWAKGQKVAQNEKIFCLSHSASQEPYIIWLWFLVHMCKIFFIFSEFWFFRFSGGYKGKKDPKLPISVCFDLYLRNCISYHWDFYNDISRCFSLFS